MTLVHLTDGVKVQGTSQAIVANSAVYTGRLDPLSDTGPLDSDGITSNNQPTFVGTAEPNSLIEIYARRDDGLTPVLLRQAPVGPNGQWSATAPPLADGGYTVSVVVISPLGVPSAMRLINTGTLGRVVIDTVAPQVVGATYDARLGRVTVVYRDGFSGIDRDALSNPNIYTLIFGPLTRKQALAVVPRPDSASASVWTDPQGAVVVLGLTPAQGRALRVVRVVSARVTDLAGNHLNNGRDVVVQLSRGGHPTRPVVVSRPGRRR